MQNDEETLFIYDLNVATIEEDMKAAIKEIIGDESTNNPVIGDAPGKRKMAIVN